MRITNNRLVGNDGRMVPFIRAGTNQGLLTGGRPQFCVIHYTAGGTASGAINTFRGNRVSAHLVVDHDGSITQMVPFDRRGAHAGQSRWKTVNSLNGHSIGIEIVNWGKLNGGPGNWKSHVGTSVADQRVIVAEHNNRPDRSFGWEIFDAAQFDAVVWATQAIVDEFDMKWWDVVGHDDISPSRKIDPGPAFDMDIFRERVFGQDDSSEEAPIFRVVSETGLNLRTGPSIADRIVKNLPDGTNVRVISRNGNWRLVAEILDGAEDFTGFVHGRFITPA